MIKFDNKILEELSDEGKQYLGLNLQTYLATLPKLDRPKTKVGLRIAMETHQFLSNSLTEFHDADLINKRLNCKLYFCVTIEDKITKEFEMLPQHLSIEAFQYLERTLQHYNMYWNGSSMYAMGK